MIIIRRLVSGFIGDFEHLSGNYTLRRKGSQVDSYSGAQRVETMRGGRCSHHLSWEVGEVNIF